MKRRHYISMGILATLVSLAVLAQTNFIDVNVSGTLTTQDLTVNGTCTGCAGAGVAQTEGTFDASFDDACTTTPVQTWDYVKTGNVVTLRMVGGISCTGDSTSFSAPAATLPVAIRPVSPIIARMSSVTAQNNGAIVAACVSVNFLGGMQYDVGDASEGVDCGGSSSWTASGPRVVTSGTGPTMFSYLLSDPS